MDSKKILFFYSLLSILLLMLFLQNKNLLIENSIQKISFKENKVTILTTSNTSLVIFTKKQLPLKKGDIIIYTGKKGSYKRKENVIVSKIWKIEKE